MAESRRKGYWLSTKNGAPEAVTIVFLLHMVLITGRMLEPAAISLYTPAKLRKGGGGVITWDAKASVDI